MNGLKLLILVVVVLLLNSCKTAKMNTRNSNVDGDHLQDELYYEYDYDYYDQDDFDRG